MPLLLVALAACLVVDQRDWFRTRDVVLCDLYVDCFALYDDVATCRADLATFADARCATFSNGAANDCIAALRAQAHTCPTTDAAAWEIPAVCADVCRGTLP